MTAPTRDTTTLPTHLLTPNERDAERARLQGLIAELRYYRDYEAVSDLERAETQDQVALARCRLHCVMEVWP